MFPGSPWFYVLIRPPPIPYKHRLFTRRNSPTHVKMFVAMIQDALQGALIPIVDQIALQVELQTVDQAALLVEFPKADQDIPLVGLPNFDQDLLAEPQDRVQDPDIAHAVYPPPQLLSTTYRLQFLDVLCLIDFHHS